MDVLIKRNHQRQKSEQFQKRFVGRITLISKEGQSQLISKPSFFPIKKISSRPISNEEYMKIETRDQSSENQSNKTELGRALENVWKSKKLPNIGQSYMSYENSSPYVEKHSSCKIPLNYSADFNPSREFVIESQQFNSRDKKSQLSEKHIDKFKRLHNRRGKSIQIETSLYSKSGLLGDDLKKCSITELRRLVEITRPKKNYIKLPTLCIKHNISSPISPQHLMEIPAFGPSEQRKNHINKSRYRLVLQKIKDEDKYLKRVGPLNNTDCPYLKKIEIKSESENRYDWLKNMTGLQGFLENTYLLKHQNFKQ